MVMASEETTEAGGVVEGAPESHVEAATEDTAAAQPESVKPKRARKQPARKTKATRGPVRAGGYVDYRDGRGWRRES